ncbi:MAG: J domain-containing protein [Oscillospiraceae bacterium]|jgi:curved DNA-binding protein CbpA|nr:J domain-containing protein [Oscillospiraceae bacterium]
MTDPYQVLGVPSTASDDEVKRAYRELAHKYHPDNYRDNPLSDLAEQKMKEINEAYDRIQRMRSGEEQPGSQQTENPYAQYQQPRQQYYSPPRYQDRGGPVREPDYCSCCTQLLVADCCCECMGGDLIRCC